MKFVGRKMLFNGGGAGFPLPDILQEVAAGAHETAGILGSRDSLRNLSSVRAKVQTLIEGKSGARRKFRPIVEK
jgi:hypothetical protein